MSTANLACPECGKEIDIDVKRVGREFGVIASCCSNEFVVGESLKASHELAYGDLMSLRNGKYNRRKGERRQHA